jgi:predicted ATPase
VLGANNGIVSTAGLVVGGDVRRYQVLDQLTLLVDQSLVVADNATGRTRYRMLETVGQYRQFPRFARSSQRSP